MTQRQVFQQSEISSWKKIFTGRLGIYTLVLNLAIALFGIDIFVISTIMPTIVADIGGAQFYSWTVMLYMVGSIIGSSSAGPVKELFGRRSGYVFAGLLFAIGNLGAFFAPDMVILLIWRLVQGLGGGLMVSQSFGLVGDVFPSELRVRILSMISTTWGLATIIGPGFGGIFAEFTIWRAAFACVVPLGLVFVLLAWRFIPSSAGKGLTKQSISIFPIYRLAGLGGSILCVGFSSQFEETFIRAALILVAIGLVVLAFRRDTISDNPIFPKKTLVINSEIGSAYWIILLTTMSFVFGTIYVTLYLQVIHNQAPLVAAYIHALMSLSWTASSLMVASISGRPIWWVIIGGVFLILVGIVLLAIWAVSGSVIAPILGLILVGFGMGLSNNHIIALAISAVPDGQSSLAGSAVQTIRNLGIGFGSASAGLFANIGGLADAGIKTNTAGKTVALIPEEIVYAIDLVHRVDIIIASTALIVTLIFYAQARKPEL